MLRFALSSSVLLCCAFSLACGGASKQQAATSAAAAQASTMNALPTPELSGTPVPVCPRLAAQGVGASSFAVDGGFAIDLGTFDEELAEQLRSQSEEYVEARSALEQALQHVQASQHDDGQGIYIRFEHPNAELLEQLSHILQAGIDKRPAAARRVTIRQNEGNVEMQLPGGGPLITARTNDAAKDTVQKWTDREPTDLQVEDIEHGVRITIRSSDRERLDDLRHDATEALFTCGD